MKMARWQTRLDRFPLRSRDEALWFFDQLGITILAIVTSRGSAGDRWYRSVNEDDVYGRFYERVAKNLRNGGKKDSEFISTRSGVTSPPSCSCFCMFVPIVYLYVAAESVCAYVYSFATKLSFYWAVYVSFSPNFCSRTKAPLGVSGFDVLIN